MKIEPKTLKGFRDFLPMEARKRQYVIDTLRKVFESYGFEPLETPSLEYAEVLEGKYGDEGERLMYKFEDKGGRKVAMRYDQTVPLARVVAQYANALPLPFKRYQIQNVWRGENPQKGRFREFLQCDIDTVGTDSILSDAEIIEIAIKCLEKLGFEKFKILINDRAVFRNIPKQAISAIDKIKKIGEEAVLKELSEMTVNANVLANIRASEPTPVLKGILKILKDQRIVYEPTLSRGLDYYTGLIFEIEIEGYEAGSVCGGGRYDNLIGIFTNRQIPAVGCSFGFDRILEAMDRFDLFPKNLQTTRVLVGVFSEELSKKSSEAASLLRANGINTEVYPDTETKIDKQLRYADQKGIPFVLLIGPKEAESNSATFKNMKTGEQKELKIDEIAKKIAKN